MKKGSPLFLGQKRVFAFHPIKPFHLRHSTTEKVEASFEFWKFRDTTSISPKNSRGNNGVFSRSNIFNTGNSLSKGFSLLLLTSLPLKLGKWLIPRFRKVASSFFRFPNFDKKKKKNPFWSFFGVFSLMHRLQIPGGAVNQPTAISLPKTQSRLIKSRGEFLPSFLPSKLRECKMRRNH